VPSPDEIEWLEADGLGGFAMGTLDLVRTRRYHGLLVSAMAPPSDRRALVAGIEAWIETSAGTFALSAQRYASPNGDVTHPDGASRIVERSTSPWPTWTFALPDGMRIVHELFVPRGRAAVMLRWRMLAGSGRLFVRPLLAARDFHTLRRETKTIEAHPIVDHGRVAWRPYADAPEIVAIADARYEHDPSWYRRFVYAIERERGLDNEDDLWSPGSFATNVDADHPLAIGFTTRSLEPALATDPRSAHGIFAELASRERARRSGFTSDLARAADAYVVRRGEGRTIIAGYPWFGDWGRDTFIAMRGLCLATGRLDEAGAILAAWASHVDRGMLPNRFPDHGEAPEYNSVDAALWYVVAAREYLSLRPDATETDALHEAMRAIARGHLDGTRFGIHVDRDDGLLAAGERGQQLTWMDARSAGREVTPRIGKPVEVNALWLNVLDAVRAIDPTYERDFDRAAASFCGRFPIGGRLADVVDVDHVRGAVDAAMRPNQILAVGGLPLPAIEGALARSIVDAVEAKLLTPIGLRTLASDSPGYTARYEGGPDARDAAYHQGTVWPWLIGPFVDAWLRVRGDTPEAKREARERFYDPLIAKTNAPGAGHLTEIADAEPPHRARGCPFQAWSLGELIRIGARVA
jgi:predicted glycogen debranching enzyme